PAPPSLYAPSLHDLFRSALAALAAGARRAAAAPALLVPECAGPGGADDGLRVRPADGCPGCRPAGAACPVLRSGRLRRAAAEPSPAAFQCLAAVFSGLSGDRGRVPAVLPAVPLADRS